MTVLKSVHKILFAGDKVVAPDTLFEPETEEQETFFLKHGSAIETDAAEKALYESEKASRAATTKTRKTSVATPAAVATPSGSDDPKGS